MRKPIAIPSYLIALAAGDVVYRQFPPVGDETWTTGIWTEECFMDRAYSEFNGAPAKYVPSTAVYWVSAQLTRESSCRFLKAEEAIVTPYRFGVYDLLVLPYAFPYGGMVG